MNKDEFKDAIHNLIEKFDPEHKFDVFIFMLDTTTGRAYNTGYGCEGCITDVIAAMKAQNKFMHFNSEGTKH